MSQIRKIAKRTRARALRVRKKIKLSDYLRVSVFRSLKYTYAQIIDDKKGETLLSYSSKDIKDFKKSEIDKKDIAHKVGLELAKKALDLGIKKVVFDRGSYLFHGRVKSLADGLREGGLDL